jgi:hypothetical protein
MVILRAMDYDKRELLSIYLAMGSPALGSVKVLNHLDQELEGLDKVTLHLNERSEFYEAEIVINGKKRIATIVGVESPGSQNATRCPNESPISND